LNKKLVVLAMLLAVKSAFAQSSPSSIEMYGIIDIGVGHDSHALSEDSNFPTGMAPVITKTANSSVTGMFNGGVSPSRIGFRGTEDLGDGLKAIFTLETGFNPEFGSFSNGVASVANNTSTKPTTFNGDSSISNQLFNRQAWVGLQSKDWGAIMAGRNYSLGYDVLLNYDPMEGSQMFSPFGYSGSYAGGGYTEDFRIDNSLKYKYTNSGFNVGVLYKFGGQAGSTSAQSIAQLTAGYENGPFGIQGTYSHIKDALSAGNSAVLGDVSLTAADTKSYMLAASYKIDAFRVRGGYQRQEFTNPSNPTLDQGLTTVLGYPVTGAVNVTAFNHEKKLDVYFIGLTYDMSANFSGTVAYYQVKQNDYSGGTCTGSNVSTCAGDNKFYSLLGQYKFSKRTSVYAGYMYNKVSDGLAVGFTHDNNGILGAGIRHAF
jgi:GBP family porin